MSARRVEDIPELAHTRGLEYDEWTTFLGCARARLDAARAAYAAAAPSRRRPAVLHRAYWSVVWPLVIWDTTARPAAIARLRDDVIEWRPSGEATVSVLDKGPAVRIVALTASTGNLLREMLDLRPSRLRGEDGAAWLWEGQRPGMHASVDAMERVVHAVALEAGVQRYLPGGRARERHRHLVTCNAIRALAEGAARELGGVPEIMAAEVAGHSVEMSRRAYRRTSASKALYVARAREMRDRPGGVSGRTFIAAGKPPL